MTNISKGFLTGPVPFDAFTVQPPAYRLPYPATNAGYGVDPTKYKRSYTALRNNQPMEALKILFNERLPLHDEETKYQLSIKVAGEAAQAAYDTEVWC